MRSRAGVQVALVLGAVILAGGVVWLALAGGRAGPVEPAAPGAGGVSVVTEERHEELVSTAPAPAMDGAKPVAERTVANAGARDGEPVHDDSELAQAIWIEGRVELATGTPMDEDVWVVAKGRDFERRPLHRARIGADGRFRVAFEKSTRTGWLDLAARYAYLAKPEAIRMAKPPKDVVLKGLLGGCVRGRILLPASAQDLAPDVVRGRVRAGERGFDFFDDSHVDGRIFADLRYEVGGIAPGVDRHVSLLARGFLPLDAGDVAIEAGIVTARDIEPEVGTAIRGRVTTADGTPLADAVVDPVFRGKKREFERFGSDIVRSAKDGSFEIVGLKGGDLLLVVQKAAFAPLKLELGDVPLGSRKTGVLAVMSEGQSIAGRVQFSDDKPAARALVEVEEQWVGERIGVEMPEAPVETGPDGSFRVTGLTQPLATVTARAWLDPDAEAEPAAPAGEPKRVRRRGTPWSVIAEKVPVGAADVVLTLTKGDSIRGRVVDSQGKPVERFKVHADPDSSSEGCAGEVARLERSFRAADGRFELDGLKPCTWSVRVESKGLLDSVVKTVRMPGAQGELEFRLLRLARLSGVVVGPDGQPVAGAEVACRAAAEDIWSGWRTDTRADAKGAFTIRSGPLGPASLVARAPELARSVPLRLDLGADTLLEGLELRLRAGASLTGSIAERDRKQQESWRVTISSMQDERTATVDEAGAFRFSAVTPGHYDVEAQAGGRDSLVRLRKQIDLRDGEAAHVELEGSARQVRVHGKIEPPDVVGGFALIVYPLDHENDDSRGKQVYVAKDSTYEVTVAGSGQYCFQLGSDHKNAARVRVRVPAVEDFEHDMVLSTGRIQGRVVDADGAPVGDFHVELRGTAPRASDDSLAQLQASTDDQGEFEFRWLEAGTYDLDARADDGTWWDAPGVARGRASKRGVVVKAGEGTSGVELVVGKGGVLKGVVRNAAGALMPRAEICAFDAAGRAVALRMERHTDNAGRFELEDLPLGRVFVLARTPSGAAKTSATVREDPSGDVEIVLAPCGTLGVRVVDSAGTPVWAGLEIVDGDGCHFEELSAPPFSEPQPAGTRVWPGLPAGRYAVRAHAAQGGSASRDAQVSGGEITSVTLSP